MIEEFPSHSPKNEPTTTQDAEPASIVPLRQIDEQTSFPFSFAPPPPARLPNLLHLLFMGMLFSAATLSVGLAAALIARFHLWGIAHPSVFIENIRYALTLQVIIYLLTLAACLSFLPRLWQKPFFQTLSWHAREITRRIPMLLSAVLLCYTLAILSTLIFHESETNAPIEQAFQQKGAPWLLFLFGITIAPFFEEMVFRGFMLPALATAYDWSREKLLHLATPQNEPDGAPQWTKAALLFAALLTSLSFALIHAPQTAGSKESFALLFSVSLVLCFVRLRARSLAASTLVHALYNFILFAMMLIYTHGFQHMENMR